MLRGQVPQDERHGERGSPELRPVGLIDLFVRTETTGQSRIGRTRLLCFSTQLLQDSLTHMLVLRRLNLGCLGLRFDHPHAQQYGVLETVFKPQTLQTAKGRMSLDDRQHNAA